MTDYSVYNTDGTIWYDGERQTYVVARKVLEARRAAGYTTYQVREYPTGTEAVGYNIWCITPSGDRWTKNGYGVAKSQNVWDPVPLTYKQAEEVLDGTDRGMTPQIVEIGSDLSPQPVFGTPGEAVAATPASVAAPTPTDPAPPPMATIDFDAYNGFTGRPTYGMRQLQSDVDPSRDPYTGLPKEK